MRRLTEEEQRQLNELWDIAVPILIKYAQLSLHEAQEMASVYTTAIGDGLVTVRSVVRVLLRLTQLGIEKYEPPMTIQDLHQLEK